MCGIIGYTNNVSNNQSVIENMLQKISHRGPDDQGYYQDTKNTVMILLIIYEECLLLPSTTYILRRFL